MRLNEISDKVGATKPRKRVAGALARAWARPPARGTKARRRAAAASGFVGFEGGQMPLYRRLPKRGFKNPFRPNTW